MPQCSRTQCAVWAAPACGGQVGDGVDAFQGDPADGDEEAAAHGLHGLDRVGEAEWGKHRPEDGDLVGLGGDFALSGGQAGSGFAEVDLGSVGSAGAADGLAVDGERVAGSSAGADAGTVGIAGSGETGADRRVAGDAQEDPPHGGLGRRVHDSGRRAR
ncbi:hypothetical protein ACIHEI_08840 [Kitasatospora sp. NPDC051984]|uniref:hypothetical protein n=1 Tax=Kitasatospora sp. NPDC051984 TaxID=3364059 RepID=UPI0037C6DF91